MYPFVPQEALNRIFGRNLFYSEDSIPIVRELTGLETKPFECVGTTQEIIAALSLAAEKTKRAGEPLSAVLRYATESIKGMNGTSAAAEILGSYGPHRVPPEFESLLTKALNDSPRSL
jgi:hypothetical protein